jgi:hypothetical protein
MFFSRCLFWFFFRQGKKNRNIFTTKTLRHGKEETACLTAPEQAGREREKRRTENPKSQNPNPKQIPITKIPITQTFTDGIKNISGWEAQARQINPKLQITIFKNSIL